MKPGYVWYILTACVIATSALTWALIMLFAVSDSKTGKEKNVKRILLWYFLSTLAAWFAVVVYAYVPAYYPYIHSLTYLSVLLITVIFFQFIYTLTITRPNDRFPRWHYAAPVLICLALLVWSFFIPFDVQVQLRKGQGAIVPEYTAYSHFFLLKPRIRLVFCLVYLILSILRVQQYGKDIHRRNHPVRNPTPWILTLLFTPVTMLVLALLRNTIPPEKVLVFGGVHLFILLILILHGAVGYNVIRRNFLLYIPLSPEPLPSKTTKFQAETTDSYYGKNESKRLTRKSFETYIQQYKPYLDPQLKLTDLLEPLQTNRTLLSGFINRTYRMNFNRYINVCRLKELQRLCRSSAHQKKEMNRLIAQAGFASRRNYVRALAAENEKKET